jgi:hypothetical protein
MVIFLRIKKRNITDTKYTEGIKKLSVVWKPCIMFPLGTAAAEDLWTQIEMS